MNNNKLLQESSLEKERQRYSISRYLTSYRINCRQVDEVDEGDSEWSFPIQFFNGSPNLLYDR